MTCVRVSFNAPTMQRMYCNHCAFAITVRLQASSAYGKCNAESRSNVKAQLSAILVLPPENVTVECVMQADGTSVTSAHNVTLTVSAQAQSRPAMLDIFWSD